MLDDVGDQDGSIDNVGLADNVGADVGDDDGDNVGLADNVGADVGDDDGDNERLGSLEGSVLTVGDNERLGSLEGNIDMDGEVLGHVLPKSGAMSFSPKFLFSFMSLLS
jgi:hypothetical protein